MNNCCNQTIEDNDKIWLERLREHEPRWVKDGFEKAKEDVLKIIDRICRGEKTSIDRLRVELKEEIKNLTSNDSPQILNESLKHGGFNSQGQEMKVGLATVGSANDSTESSPDIHSNNCEGCEVCLK